MKITKEIYDELDHSFNLIEMILNDIEDEKTSNMLINLFRNKSDEFWEVVSRVEIIDEN